MQTQDRKDAEEKIYALRKKIDLCARAGDISEISRLQLEISQLQQASGAVSGHGKDTENVGIDY